MRIMLLKRFTNDIRIKKQATGKYVKDTPCVQNEPPLRNNLLTPQQNKSKYKLTSVKTRK